MDNKQAFLEQCKFLIEKKLGWSDSRNWQNQNFESLSVIIYEETNVSLSVSTLKRIWGKVKYDSIPNLTTLNALAQFIGFVNWQQFINSQALIDQQKIVTTKSEKSNGKRALRIVLPGIVFLSVVLWVLFFRVSKTKTLTYKNISFTSNPVTKGVPNTVIFKYDAKDSNADSLFIQQSWDPKRRFRVEKKLNEYTSTYYFPGYFRAKLILNDSIVMQHDLLIESEGWLGTVDYEPIPTYIKKDSIEKGKSLIIDINDVPDKEKFEEQKAWTTLHKVSNEMSVPSDNFTMETEVRNTYSKQDGICQLTEILLIGTEDVIIIPLSIKGCVGEVDMYINSRLIDGQVTDLSNFGVDFSNYVRVKCISFDKKFKIFINNSLAYLVDDFLSIGKIVGVRIRFRGTGEVKKFELFKI